MLSLKSELERVCGIRGKIKWKGVRVKELGASLVGGGVGSSMLLPKFKFKISLSPWRGSEIWGLGLKMRGRRRVSIHFQ